MNFIVGLLLCCLSFCSTDLNADDNSEVKTFVESTANEAIKMIADSGKSEKAIKAEFKKIVDQKFNMKAICNYILGRERKNELKKLNQYEEFVSLSSNMLIKLYCSKFKDYKGSELKVKKVQKNGIIYNAFSSLKISNGSVVNIVWMIQKDKDGHFKVFDAKVENASMKETLKGGVNGMISNKKMPIFMDEFRKKYAEL